MADNNDSASPREPSFWDSMWGMGFLVAAILLSRFYILEPFKIPSGSMEPTLIGHEDFGDRIVTNKLAYVEPKQVMIVMACSALLILIGFIISKGWKRTRSIVFTVLLFLGVVGGIGLSWAQGAVAGEPQRFDVVVFHYNDAWAGNKPQEINYIKRLIGLPGETIMISGGDLYLRKPGGRDEIIRKPNYRANLQETLWYPVSKAWSPQVHETPKSDNPSYNDIMKTLQDIQFPWNGVEAGNSGATLNAKSLALDGSAPVTLEYKYPVSNIYLKQGRWPFEHAGCPETRKPGIPHPDGGVIANPENKTRDITAYVSNTYEGVQCPNCKQILYPIRLDQPSFPAVPDIEPSPSARFFYGGEQRVGDLRLDMNINVESAGAIQLEVGSDMHSAAWSIGEIAGKPADNDTVHPVKVPTPSLSAGPHSLSLAYIDGCVIAMLDGQVIDKQEIEIKPPGRAADNLKNVIKVKFTNVKGTVTKLDLFRDLYYTSRNSPVARGKQRGSDGVGEGGYLRYLEEGGFVAEIEKDGFLMFGDNSPGSSDSRLWGTVPRKKLIGRASFVWWPPSRWRLIK